MPHLLTERRDGIAIVTLNRPEKRNALSPEMVVRLADFWRDFKPKSDEVMEKKPSEVTAELAVACRRSEGESATVHQDEHLLGV